MGDDGPAPPRPPPLPPHTPRRTAPSGRSRQPPTHLCPAPLGTPVAELGGTGCVDAALFQQERVWIEEASGEKIMAKVGWWGW